MKYSPLIQITHIETASSPRNAGRPLARLLHRGASLAGQLGMGAALVLLFWTMPAFGENSTTAQSPQAESRELMEQGFKANQAGDKEGARELYDQSFTTYPSYDVACNLGTIELSMGLYFEAARHLDYCLRHFPTGESRALKKSMEEAFQKARQFVGAVKFEVSEPGARVLVDDKEIGASPLEREIFVRAGHHTARAELNGRETEVSFSVGKGESTEVELTLPKSDVGPLVDSGLGASEPQSYPGKVTPTSEAPAGKRNWVPAYVLGGVTVAALGTSMVFRGLAGSTKDEAREVGQDLPNDSCENGASGPVCNELEQLRDRLRMQSTISNVTLIGAAVLGAATVGYVVYQLGKSPSGQSVEARAIVSPTGGQFTILGTF